VSVCMYIVHAQEPLNYMTSDPDIWQPPSVVVLGSWSWSRGASRMISSSLGLALAACGFHLGLAKMVLLISLQLGSSSYY